MDQTLPSPQAQKPLFELLRLAAPTILQMLSYTLMQFLDTWMLAHYGASHSSALEPTAASNSGLFGFSVISLGMGVLFVVNTLVSQSFGQRKFPACGRYLWQGIWFSLMFYLLLLPALPMLGPVFKALGHEPDLVAMEATYLHIILMGAILKLLQTAFGQFLIGIDRPGCVLISTAMGVSVNALVAWVMIFGQAGVAPMGIRGAAHAQNIGVFVEMAVLMYFAFQPRVRKTFGGTDWRPRLAELKTLLFVGVPAGIQLIADVLAWSLFSMWVMGRFGTKTMAANAFMFRYMVVSFMPAFGMGNAVTTLVGRYIGMNRLDLAKQRADLAFKVCAAYMLTCGLLFFLGRNWLIGFFTKDPEILHIGAMLLTFAAIYQFFDAMYIVYNGALRGAGDTMVPAIATGTLCWGITVLGGYALATYSPGLGAAGPWSAATTYGIILGIFMIIRFRRGAWKSIRLEPTAAADRVRGIEVVT